MDANVHQDDKIILLGDFNLCDIQWNSHEVTETEVTHCENLLDLAFCFNLCQIVSKYTLVLNDAFAIVDLLFVSSFLETNVRTCDVIGGISDHKIFMFRLDITATKLHGDYKNTVLNFAAADYFFVLEGTRKFFW